MTSVQLAAVILLYRGSGLDECSSALVLDINYIKKLGSSSWADVILILHLRQYPVVTCYFLIYLNSIIIRWKIIGQVEIKTS